MQESTACNGNMPDFFDKKVPLKLHQKERQLGAPVMEGNYMYLQALCKTWLLKT